MRSASRGSSATSTASTPGASRGGCRTGRSDPMDPRELLGRDLVLHLVTLRRDGAPRITPLWFIYEDYAFHMTSGAGKPHLRDLARDPRCAVIVGAEIDPAPDGERRY